MHSNVKISLICLCVVAVLGVGSVDRVLAQGTQFIIGVEDLEYYPHYTYEDGQYKGYARDVLDAFAQSQGCSFSYKPLPIKRLFTELIEGRVDFKYPDNPYWAGDLKKGKDVRYSESIVDYIDGVMVLPARKGMDIKALKKLGTVRGFTPWDYLDLIKSNQITLDENSNFSGLLKQVLLKRIDGAYINTAVAQYQLANTLDQPDGLVFDPGLPHTKSSYFISTVKHPEVIEEVNRFLEAQKALVDKLKSQYGVTVK